MALRDDLKRQQQEDSLVRRVLRSGSVPDDFRINLRRFRSGEISAKDVVKEKKLKTAPKGRVRIEDPSDPSQTLFGSRRTFDESVPRELLVQRAAKEQREKRIFDTEVNIQESQNLLEAALQDIFDVQQDPTGRGIPVESTGQQIFQELGLPDEQFEDRLRQQAIEALTVRNKAIDEPSIQSIVEQLKQGETIE